MINFNELIQDPEQYQSFVRELSSEFKAPKFPALTEDKYSETRQWKAVAALNGRIPMASMIDPYSGKPIIGSEKALDLFGEMPTFGNMATFSAKEFTEMGVIERGIAANLVDPMELIKYLFNHFERLSVSPLVTVDKLFYEAISNGTSTIAAADNLSGLSMSIDWGMHKIFVPKVWSDVTALGLEDLKTLYFYMYDNFGIVLDKFTLNRTTFAQLQAQTATKNAITSYFAEGGTTTKYTGTPSKDAINNILINGMMLPPIEIENHMIAVLNSDGKTIKKNDPAFMNGRVTGSVGNILGQYIWTPADEQRRPDKNVLYQDIDHVLISTRMERGKVSFESELSAICVPTQMDEMCILVTDALS